MKSPADDIVHRTYDLRNFPSITHAQLVKWSEAIEQELFATFNLLYAKAIFYLRDETVDTKDTVWLKNLTLLVHIAVAGKKGITGLDLRKVLSFHAVSLRTSTSISKARKTFTSLRSGGADLWNSHLSAIDTLLNTEQI